MPRKKLQKSRSINTTAVLEKIRQTHRLAQSVVKSAHQARRLANDSSDIVESLIAGHQQVPSLFNRLRDSMEASEDVFWDWDLKADTLWRSDAFFDLFGYSNQQVPKSAALSLWHLMHPGDKQRVLQSIQRAIKTRKRAWSQEYRLLRADGVYARIMDRAVIRYNQDRVAVRMVGILRDVTEQHTVESTLRAQGFVLEAQVARQLSELTSVKRELETLSYTIGHDLRAPLRAISGFSHAILEEETSLTEDTRRRLSDIIANAEGMGKLIDDLLAYSRLSRKPFQALPVNLRQMVANALDVIQRRYPQRKISVTIDLLPRAVGDPVLLYEAILQLLSNAFKFTRQRSHPRIRIGLIRKNGEVVIYIRDNGVGFDMKYSSSIFKVFKKLHHESEFEGKGIGLAIVHLVAIRHGGKAWAESEPGKGTTFFLSIPFQEFPTGRPLGDRIPSRSRN